MLNWVDGDLLARYERVRVLFDEERKLSLYTPETIVKNNPMPCN